jgi:hypothetical protein
MLPIIHVSFPSRALVAAACGRFGEFASHPDFKGKVFHWDDLKKWEIERYGAFRYLDFWEGFTLYGRDLQPFREGRFDPLTDDERRLLALLDDADDETVVIASAEGDRETFSHELVHALYERVADYRDSVDAAFGGARLPKMHAELRKMSYREDALVNESNAYLATGLEPAMRGLRERLAAFKARGMLKKRFGWDPRGALPAALLADIRMRKFVA